MSSSPLVAARDAIVTVWDANWAGSEPVLWQQNTVTNITPDISEPLWLHIEVEHAREQIAAFGGGPRAANRLMTGVVTLRAFTLAGGGENDVLDLLDRAVDALRGRQSGVTFFGDIRYSNARPSEDGLWTWRTALLGFEFRFTG